MLDPRVSIIDKRLSNIDRIIVVSSGKGGVGKSLIASTLALLFGRKGFKTGLLDLDFTSPTTHVVLGANNLRPIEDRGVVPPEIHGIKYMSLVFYLGEHVSPLRGTDLSNAFLELLAITRWGKLDFLIIDMPPGISDATLDLLRFVGNIKFLIVTTPSQLAFETVRKFIELLSEIKVPVIGVIENMKMKDSTFIKQQVESKGVRFLGEIPFDPQLEESIGNVERFLATRFSKALEKIIERNLKPG